MEFGADTWWLVGLAVTIAIGIIGYFLKRTMSKQDQHEADINHIKLTYVTKEEFKSLNPIRQQVWTNCKKMSKKSKKTL